MNRANRYWLKSKELESAIERVRNLHKPQDFNGTLICPECESLGYLTPYPCNTIKALDGVAK